MTRRRMVVLFNQIREDSPEDVIDNRTQARWIARLLRKQGHPTRLLPFTPRCLGRLRDLRERDGDLRVVNLVDAAPGEENLAYLVPALLDYLKVDYTGCSHDALFLTTHKVYAKRILREHGIATPDWVLRGERERFAPGERYIVKAVGQDASIGIRDDSVVTADSLGELERRVGEREREFGEPFFAERFIDGREFNVCLYGSPDEPVVLPPYEWTFEGFAEEGRAPIISYDAKWTEESAVYRRVRPRYDLPPADAPVTARLEEIARACWRIFALRGHARVDFRLDRAGEPWVLEINCNPSFYGFWNVAKHHRLDFAAILRDIFGNGDET